jgi:hypothetical protein
MLLDHFFCDKGSVIDLFNERTPREPIEKFKRHREVVVVHFDCKEKKCHHSNGKFS